MKQEKVARHSRVNKYRETEVQEPVPDVKDEELAEQTDELLEEIACCLAEAAVTDEEKDLKAQAKAEWEANEKLRGSDWDEYWHNREVWVQKYSEVVTMKRDCCGDYGPVWDK